MLGGVGGEGDGRGEGGQAEGKGVEGRRKGGREGMMGELWMGGVS